MVYFHNFDYLSLASTSVRAFIGLLPSKALPSLIVSSIISALTHHAAYIDTLIWLKTWLYRMRPLMANPYAFTSMAHTRPPLKNKASSELPTHHGLVTVPLYSAALDR